MMLAPSRSAHFPSWVSVGTPAAPHNLNSTRHHPAGGLQNLGALPLSLECHREVEGQPKVAWSNFSTQLFNSTEV